MCIAGNLDREASVWHRIPTLARRVRSRMMYSYVVTSTLNCRLCTSAVYFRARSSCAEHITLLKSLQEPAAGECMLHKRCYPGQVHYTLHHPHVKELVVVCSATSGSNDDEP